VSRIQRDTPIKKTKQDLFLEEFAKHGNITLACRKAEIGRMTLYRWKEKSDTFLVRFNQAFEEAKDAIRAEIYRRGKEGWDEPVFQQGKLIDTVRKYSDTLLIFHAKMLMPEYRDKSQIEMSGSLDITGARETLLTKLGTITRATHNDQNEID